MFARLSPLLTITVLALTRACRPMTALIGLLLVGWSVAVIFEVIRMAD